MENQERKMNTITLTITEPCFLMIREGKKKEKEAIA